MVDRGQRKAQDGAPPVAADSARWLIEQATGCGVGIDRLLAGTGLTPEWYADGSPTLDEEQYHRLLANALAADLPPDFGLTAPRQANYLSRYGLWGYAIMSCETFRTANAIALQYWALSGSLVRVAFALEEPGACWRITPAYRFVRDRILVFAVEKAMSAACSALAGIFDRPLPMVEVRVSYPAPPYARRYREVFGCPVRFGAEANRLVMAPGVLDYPIVTRQPEMAAVAEERCRDMLAKLVHRDPFIDAVYQAIVAWPGRFPGLADVARRFALSPRTLRRRLADRGTGFRQLVGGIRTELALEYLRRTNFTIDQIADLLGYSETTTFRNAFKRWTGESASAVRRRQGRGRHR